MAMDFKSAVATVKNAYNIVDYIRDDGNTVVANGVGKWKTRCPFHNEKTPSLVINESFQNYKCFGCGVSGDIISYMMETENLSFAQSLKKLAEDKGLDIELEESTSTIDYDSLYKILKFTANFYCLNFNKLDSSHPAVSEITKRGLHYDNSDENLVKYGYSPNGSQVYEQLSKQGFSDDLIVESGVCRRNDSNGSIYDFFRQRLMFIFTDRYGKPVGFSSRKLFEDDSRGKYVNSSDSPLFNKSTVLYNHALARKHINPTKILYVCEGQFDVAAMVESGLKNVVAASGTSYTKQHAAECLRMVGLSGKIVFCFDGDDAGIAAAQKVFMNYPEVHEQSYVVTFPREEIDGKMVGMDPCDYRLKYGEEKLKEYLKNPATMVEFMIANAKHKYNMDSTVERAKYIDEASRIIKTINNRTLRDVCIKQLSLESLTSIDGIRKSVKNAKSLEFVEDSGEVVVEEKPEIESTVGENQVITDEELFELIEKDNYYKIAAKFITLGLARKEWRASVIRSKKLVPKKMHFIVDELQNLEEADVVFPEMFNNSNIAAYLMGDDFSPFYKHMDMNELKEHFIFLHNKLEESVEERRRLINQVKIKELLNGAESNDFEYFKKLMNSIGETSGRTS